MVGRYGIVSWARLSHGESLSCETRYGNQAISCVLQYQVIVCGDCMCMYIVPRPSNCPVDHLSNCNQSWTVGSKSCMCDIHHTTCKS